MGRPRRPWFSDMLSNDWAVRIARSGHWRATYVPSGATITIAATPSDVRVPKKVRSDVRRIERHGPVPASDSSS